MIGLCVALRRGQGRIGCARWAAFIVLPSLLLAFPARAAASEAEDDSAAPPVTGTQAEPVPRPVAIDADEPALSPRANGEVPSVPYCEQVVDGAFLTSQAAAPTLPDALKDVPGVLVPKTSSGQGSPYLRGFTGARTLFLIDGIRLNNAVMRDGPSEAWGTVDLLTIDRLYVVKGPVSAARGSDAIGGTVEASLRARDPDASAEEIGDWIGDVHWARRLYYRYGSGEQSHIARAETSVATGSVGVTGGFSFKDFGDIVGGRHAGQLDRTDYDALDGDVKAVWRVRKGMDLVAAYQRAGLEDVPRTHSTVFSESFHGTAVGTDLLRETDRVRHLGYLQLHWKDAADWLTSVVLSVSYHEQDEDHTRVRSDEIRTQESVDDGTTGAWIQLESPSPIGTFTYGVEHYHDDVRSASRVLNPDGSLLAQSHRGPVADDSTYDLLGVYVEDRVSLGDRFDLVLGGRYTYARAIADDVDPDPSDTLDFDDVDRGYDAFAGSLRGTFHASKAWDFFGGVSQGYRPPNLADLTRFEVNDSGEVETPAPHLDAERYLAFEAGVKARSVDWRISTHAAYHYTFLNDLIVPQRTGNTVDGLPEVTRDNVGDGFVHGVELGVSWEVGEGWTAFGSFGWLEGENDARVGATEERRPLSRLQPASSLVGLRWDSRNRRYFVEGTAQIVGGQGRLSPDDRNATELIPPDGTPGYTIYTLRAGAELIRGFRIFAGVENLSSRDYRVHGSGQNEPGTNAIGGVDWRF